MDKFNLSIDLSHFQDQIKSEIQSHIKQNMRGIIAEYFQAPGTWKNAQAGYGYMCIQKALDDIMDNEEFQTELKTNCNKAMHIALQEAITLAAERSAKKLAFTTTQKPFNIGDIVQNKIMISIIDAKHEPGQQFRIKAIKITDNGIFYDLDDFCGRVLCNISHDSLKQIKD